MRAAIDFGTLFGCIAVVASLTLLSPGVTVVKAELIEDSAATAAPACNASPDATAINEIDRIIESAQLEVATEPPGDDEIVMLNGRGYNYGPAPSPDPTGVLVESGSLRR